MKIYLGLLSTSRKLSFEDIYDRLSLIDSKTPGRKTFFVASSQEYRTLNKIQERLILKNGIFCWIYPSCLRAVSTSSDYLSWYIILCFPSRRLIFNIIIILDSIHWITERQKERLDSLGAGSVSGALVSNSCFTSKESGLISWEAASVNVGNWSRVQRVIVLTSKVDLISSQLCNFLPFPILFSLGCHNDKAIPWDV